MVTYSGSTEWVSKADFIARGSFENTPNTNDFVIQSVGDVEIGPNGGVGTYSITTPLLRVSAGRGMQITNAVNDVLVAAPAMTFNTGTTEDYSAVRVGISGSNNRIAVTNTGGDTNFLSDNNLLLTGNSEVTFNAPSINGDIRFTATKGDILFRSTSANPGQHDVTVSATAANARIFITAFHRIDNRQHRRLGFFVTGAQRNRASNAVVQQGTTEIVDNLQVRLNNPALRLNDCRCTGTVDCSNVECPDTTNRVLQMQEALVSYGLLIFA